jgi:hypothetical protein
VGERYDWYRLAYSLRIPLQECQQGTTSTEFLEWVCFLEMEEYERHSKQDHYLAQIAAEIRQFREIFSRNPRTVSMKEFLLKREEGKSPSSRASQDSSPEPIKSNDKEEELIQAQVAAEHSKAAWAARLGIKDLSEIKK